MSMPNELLSREDLVIKKSTLTCRMQELQSEIRNIGLSANQERFKPHTVNQASKVKKDKLVGEYTELTKEVVQINAVLKTKPAQEELFKTIVKETFGQGVYDLIKEECSRRGYGHDPRPIRMEKVGSDDKENLSKLRKLTVKYYQSLYEARIALTRYISNNMPLNGKEVFMKDISPVNTKLPPLAELQKEKRLYNF